MTMSLWKRIATRSEMCFGCAVWRANNEEKPLFAIRRGSVSV
jgi:hypothetical protein